MKTEKLQDQYSGRWPVNYQKVFVLPKTFIFNIKQKEINVRCLNYIFARRAETVGHHSFSWNEASADRKVDVSHPPILWDCPRWEHALTSAFILEIREVDHFLGEDKQAEPSTSIGFIIDWSWISHDLLSFMHQDSKTGKEVKDKREFELGSTFSGEASGWFWVEAVDQEESVLPAWC